MLGSIRRIGVLHGEGEYSQIDGYVLSLSVDGGERRAEQHSSHEIGQSGGSHEGQGGRHNDQEEGSRLHFVFLGCFVEEGSLNSI